VRPAVVRVTLAEECPDALLAVLGAGDFLDRRELARPALVGAVGVPVHFDQFLGVAHREVGVGRDLAGELEHLVEQIVVRDDALHEPDAFGLVGHDDAAGEDQLQRLADAHQLGQVPRAARFGQEAGRHRDLAELGLVGRDAEIAKRANLKPDADGGAVDGGDGDRLQVLELLERALQHLVAEIVEEIMGEFLVGPEIPHVEIGIGAGAKRIGFGLEIAARREPPPRTGDDHYLDIGIVADLVAQDVELDPHADVDGVQRLGPVQRDQADALLARPVGVVEHLPFERLVFHVLFLSVGESARFSIMFRQFPPPHLRHCRT
jgi:hypothetical protein